jgi:hypothetical protein
MPFVHSFTRLSISWLIDYGVEDSPTNEKFGIDHRQMGQGEEEPGDGKRASLQTREGERARRSLDTVNVTVLFQMEMQQKRRESR